MVNLPFNPRVSDKKSDAYWYDDARKAGIYEFHMMPDHPDVIQNRNKFTILDNPPTIKLPPYKEPYQDILKILGLIGCILDPVFIFIIFLMIQGKGEIFTLIFFFGCLILGIIGIIFGIASFFPHQRWFVIENNNLIYNQRWTILSKAQIIYPLNYIKKFDLFLKDIRLNLYGRYSSGVLFHFPLVGLDFADNRIPKCIMHHSETKQSIAYAYILNEFLVRFGGKNQDILETPLQVRNSVWDIE